MTQAIPQVEEKAFLRQEEKDKYLSVILERKSFLVVADAGSGKTTMAIALRDELKVRKYAVAVADYSDSAKLTLISIADQFAIATFYMVDTAKGGEKKVQLTVPELKEAIAKYLTNNENSVLICDNAHRYPVTLRYWLEEVVKKGSVLMFATHPPRKEIFLLIPRIEMKSLQTSDMRSLMLEEASNLGVKVDTSKLAELEERAVGNPHLAKRVIQEEALGLAQEEAGDHVNYIDGTPFFIAALSLVAIARFIGLGMGDKGLYIVGGIAMVLTITLRVFFTAINRKSSKL